MPKVKTNRGAAKRFRKTAGKKIKRGSAFRRHILTTKTTKQKRHLRAGGYVAPADLKRVLSLLPNG